ncbi:glycerophosphodiester phosphodiesterase family protein [Parvularcula lutaonensis]|uniref:Glycerophosphodiester phosphodiesterase family protein n=1 Tax=Parvularcula lutaonensis TaxID=491923 RepID=A0ABV7MA22_9PROT|nr:glycerophosphodiester phosphodiesterase family protein [Parvularcula lutaonensis]GGY36581.1 glycerophosphoryl diester phosphodiesterase [Parvularcula lutaonensis]
MKRLVFSAFTALSLSACGDTLAPDVAAWEVPVLDATGHPTAASFMSCMEGKAAIVSAHRGGPAPGYPENAIETFLHTLSEVPALIETDVRETADGVLILLHDDTVDRTTNGTGNASQMTLAEIKALRLVDADGRLTEYRVPTLDEALEAMRGRTILQLDVKRGVGLAKVVRAVERAGAESYAAIITYNDNGAVIAAEAGDNITVIAGIDEYSDVASLGSRGLDRERLIAWTGIIDELEPDLYEALGELDISASGGALRNIDRRAAEGEVGLYKVLEQAGLDVIATDMPVRAARYLGMSGISEAIELCAL